MLEPLTALVIDQETRRPGDGFIAWDIDDFETAQRRVYDADWSQVENPFVFAVEGQTYESLAKQLLRPNLDLSDIYRLVKTRGVQQVVFRKALLLAYRGRCAISSSPVASEEMLEAAHILPYSQCNSAERLDPQNGILVSFIYHRFLDMDWIRLTPDFRIIPGRELPLHLSDQEAALIHRHCRGQLWMPERTHNQPNPDYIRRRYAL